MALVRAPWTALGTNYSFLGVFYTVNMRKISRHHSSFLTVPESHVFFVLFCFVFFFRWQVMRKLKLVPLGSESVEEKVAAFRQYNDEVGFDFQIRLKPITDYYCGYFD